MSDNIIPQSCVVCCVGISAWSRHSIRAADDDDQWEENHTHTQNTFASLFSLPPPYIHFFFPDTATTTMTKWAPFCLPFPEIPQFLWPAECYPLLDCMGDWFSITATGKSGRIRRDFTRKTVVDMRGGVDLSRRRRKVGFCVVFVCAVVCGWASCHRFKSKREEWRIEFFVSKFT